MATNAANVQRVRYSILELAQKYEAGDKAPLEKLIRAWNGIKDLPPDNANSFFSLGGFHGEPFRGAGWGLGNSFYWGGYCNHGNILFPTWHRVYCLKVEDALRSVPGCEDVTLPYWDETDSYSRSNGIPWPLTVDTIVIGDVPIKNPLKSFVFPRNVIDSVGDDNGLYTKPATYETVRYPLSGLVGTPDAAAATKIHNDKYKSQATVLLNSNVKAWLNNVITIKNQQVNEFSINSEFFYCLQVENYTLFSNVSSAQEYNSTMNPRNIIVPLEQPHNDIHLAVGGFDVPSITTFDASAIPGANGDMGENNTAGLDPIFFFHHCNVDRMFWVWQKKWKKRNANQVEPDIMTGYPGTNSSDNQGATPGIIPNTWLDFNTPLLPFKRPDGNYYTSRDCINIETQLGYTYTQGSYDSYQNLEEEEEVNAAEKEMTAELDGEGKKLVVSKINRAAISGSFIIVAYAKINGERYYIGHKSILSRWSVQGCANCQNHLEVMAFFDLDKLHAHLATINAEVEEYDIEIIGRQQSKPVLDDIHANKKYRLEVR